MRTMSDEEYRAFMMHGTRTAKAATVSASGLPHVKPTRVLARADIAGY